MWELCRAALQDQFSQIPSELSLWARLLRALGVHLGVNLLNSLPARWVQF